MKLLLSVLLLAAAWEALAQAGLVSAMLFPAPSVTLAWLGESFASGEMPAHLRATAQRLSAGVGLGAAAGLLVGLAVGLSDRVARIAEPVVVALHPIPKLALLPLFLVLFGFGETSRVLPIALATFFPMAVGTAAGVLGIDPLIRQVARNFGARGVVLLRRVILPGALPQVATAFRLAVNAAAIVAISVEMLTSTEGLGAVVWRSWQTMRVEELYATLLLIALLGLLGQAVAHRLARLLPPNSSSSAPAGT